MKILRHNIKIIETPSFDIMYLVPYRKLLKIEKDISQMVKVVLKKYWLNELSMYEVSILNNYFDNLTKDCQIENIDSQEINSIKKLNRLEILLTNSCNLSCKYCYANSGTYGQKARVFSPALIRKELKKFFPKKYHSVDIVFFFGGEPLMNPLGIQETCEFFMELYNQGQIEKIPVYTLVTNGTLISRDIAMMLAKYNVKITVSIDGPPQINDENRVDKYGNGTYSKIIEGINLLKSENANLSALEITYNQSHLDYSYDKKAIKSFFREQFGDINLIIEDCGGDSDVALTNKTPEVQLRKIDYAKAYQILTSKKRYNYSCDAGKSSMMIFDTNKYYPCHMFLKNNKYCFYDELSYKRVKKELESVNRNRRPECSCCWARDLCMACPASLLLYTNNENDLEICEKIRLRTEKTITCIVEDLANKNLKKFKSLL